MSKQSTLFKYNFTKKFFIRARLLILQNIMLVASKVCSFIAWNLTNHLKLKELFGCIKIGVIKFLQKNHKTNYIQQKLWWWNCLWCCCKSYYRRSAAEQKVKETVDKLKKERSSYTFEFKLKVLKDLNNGQLAACDVADKHGIHQSLLTKWKKRRKVYHNLCCWRNKKETSKKVTSNSETPCSVCQNFQQFVKARNLGRKVSYAWFYITANKINAELNPNALRVPPKSDAMRFIKQYNIKLRRVQRKKQAPKENFEDKLKQWHSSLREKLIKIDQSKPSYYKKWGRFQPNAWFNVDQVPLPFVTDRKKTYEVDVRKAGKKDHEVWVSQPGNVLDKRQCSLQVCFYPEDNNMKVGIKFRGTGKRISDEEKLAYHNAVNVYRQKSA